MIDIFQLLAPFQTGFYPGSGFSEFVIPLDQVNEIRESLNEAIKAEHEKKVSALIERIKANGTGDIETAHMEDDAALIAFIDSDRLREVWDQRSRWYA